MRNGWRSAGGARCCCRACAEAAAAMWSCGRQWKKTTVREKNGEGGIFDVARSKVPADLDVACAAE